MIKYFHELNIKGEIQISVLNADEAREILSKIYVYVQKAQISIHYTLNGGVLHIKLNTKRKTDKVARILDWFCNTESGSYQYDKTPISDIGGKTITTLLRKYSCKISNANEYGVTKK